MPHTSLDQLNDIERRVLLLLAEGHTIKSAAEIIGASPTALNERLREARRKTGTGSSRELARQLRTQENRDKITGIAPNASAPPSINPRQSVVRRWKAGVLVVSAIVLGLMAATIALLPQDLATSKSDPILGQALPNERNASEWQAALRSEGRDAEWAANLEAALRERFDRIAHVGGPESALRVTCGTSICEVAGTLPAFRTPREVGYADQTAVGQAMQDLQTSALAQDIRKLGIESRSNAFMSTTDTPKRVAFFFFFTRIEG